MKVNNPNRFELLFSKYYREIYYLNTIKIECQFNRTDSIYPSSVEINILNKKESMKILKSIETYPTFKNWIYESK